MDFLEDMVFGKYVYLSESGKRAENAGEAFSVLFSWNALFIWKGKGLRK